MGKKVPTYNLNINQINQMKKDATDKAVDIAFILMLGIPVMILHDKYSKLTRLSVDGKNREERFTDMCLDLYDSYVKGYLSLEDIREALAKESGVKIELKKGAKRIV